MRRAVLIATGALALSGVAGPAPAYQGPPVSEAGLAGRNDILFFCDFEGTNWTKYFSPGTRRNYGEDKKLWYSKKPDPVLHGLGAARSFHQKGQHGAGGVTHYLKDGHTEIYQRVYLYFPEDFEIRPSNGIKLVWFWAYQPGKEYTVGAGRRPNGTDKFSCHIVVERDWSLAFYCYHMDQRGGYGDTRRFRKNGGARLKKGEWNCIELGVKVNDVGEKNGELKGWFNGELKGEMKDLRLRAAEPLQIRRCSVTMYFGGAGPVNASPQDQYAYYDNYVIARKYIGPAVFKRPEGKPKRPRVVVFRPKEKADPLGGFREALAPVREKAKAGDYAAALAGCEKVVGLSEGKEGAAALAAYRDGLKAAAELKALVIAGAAGKKPTVYVDFAGRPMRMKLTGADESGCEFQMHGTGMPLKWRQLGANRFRGIAAKFVPDTPEGHLKLGQYCAAMGLKDDAEKDLEKAAASPALHAKIEAARSLVK